MGKHLFELWVLVTELIQDALGKPNQERYLTAVRLAGTSVVVLRSTSMIRHLTRLGKSMPASISLWSRMKEVWRNSQVAHFL